MTLTETAIEELIERTTEEAFDNERLVIRAHSPLAIQIREAIEAQFILVDRRNLPQITDERCINASEEWHEETGRTAKVPFGEEHQLRTAWLNLARAEFIRTRDHLLQVRRQELAEDFNNGRYEDLSADVQGLINQIIKLERQVSAA